MFTGIIESIGKVTFLQKEGSNLLMEIHSPISHELKVDQSLSHNGACLTVIRKDEHKHQVQLIEETLQKTNFNTIKIGDFINLERAMRLGDRLDGHLVQGHVDNTSSILSINDKNGSFIYTFSLQAKDATLLIPKGSICVNGVSLTLIDTEKDFFSVGIIPYTMQHTNFNNLKKGDTVNIEFDLIGKYLKKFTNTPIF